MSFLDFNHLAAEEEKELNVLFQLNYCFRLGVFNLCASALQSWDLICDYIIS